MKARDALALAVIAFAGVAGYLVVTRTMQAGGKVVEGVRTVVTRDLNPASSENVVYRNLPETWQEKIGNTLGAIFDPSGHAKYQENLRLIESAPQRQKTTATPEQIEREKRTFLYMEKSYTDPFPSSAPRVDRYAAPPDYPINF